ncbi:MAG: metal ABC transporter substrate-binding protein [Bacteroidales bacterium]|nr:metal ABC transporter substrate-binding protein [Bacteroidales bacterium]
MAALLLAPLVGVLLAGCRSGSAWPEHAGPKVVVSFAPLYSFVANVAGEHAAVQSLMSTQGPHHFDPNPSQARIVYEADLFFVNGLGLDDGLAKKMIDGSGASRIQLVNLGAGLDPQVLHEGSCSHDHGHDHAHGHAHDHEHEHAIDPHVWLGLDHAVAFVEKIREELQSVDPSHAADYDRRAAEYVEKLRKLKADGLAMLKEKKDRNIVTFHESLTYFAETFDLNIVDVIQKQPGREPTSKDLEKLIAACVEHKVRVIAVEPQYASQSSAGRIIEELKRRGIANPVLVEIDPLETANPGDLSAGWYESRMRQNLRNLADALQ